MNAPTGLSEVARAKWDELAPQVEERCQDIPPELLADLLKQYVQAYAVREAAVLQLANEVTLLASAPNGTRYPNPLFKVIEQAERTQDRIFRRLGFGQRTAGAQPEEGIDLD